MDMQAQAKPTGTTYTIMSYSTAGGILYSQGIQMSIPYLFTIVGLENSDSDVVDEI